MPNREMDKVAALLFQWEERKQLGEPIAPEALCHDSPELLPELYKRIKVLRHVDQLINLEPRETPAGNDVETQTDASEESSPDRRFQLKSSVQVVYPKIGNYQILEEIGHGGMGIVYKAYDPELDWLVAIKMLHRQKNTQQLYLDRFRAEGRLLAKLNHDHIVKIHTAGVHEEQPYFVMNYYPKGPLSKQLERFREPTVIARLMAQVARAVECAHKQNILHRDLKPGNILLDEHDRAIVSDFGLAKIMSDYFDLEPAINANTVDYQQALTATGACVGTPPYMAPEQFYHGKISKSIDIWAMGVILFELLAGTRPFKALTTQGLALEVTSGLPGEPKKMHATIPTTLSDIIKNCLATDPGKRYASASTLADDLEATLRGKTRRWVLGAGGLALLGGGFEVGRRMKAKSDLEKLDTEYAENCQEIRDELKQNGTVSLLDASGIPKTFRWRTGDPFDKDINNNGALLIKRREQSILEIIDYFNSNNFRFDTHIEISKMALSEKGSFRGISGIILSNSLISINSKSYYFMYALTFGLVTRTDSRFDYSFFCIPQDSTGTRFTYIIKTATIGNKLEHVSLSLKCMNSNIFAIINEAVTIQVNVSDIISMIDNYCNNAKGSGVIIKSATRDNTENKFLLNYGKGGFGYINELAEMRITQASFSLL